MYPAMKFKMPNTLTLLFYLMVAALVMTWIIPQGSFDTELVNGREVVLPGTFEVAEERAFMSPVELFTAVPRAFADAQAIIFFLFIIGGVLAIIRKTGTIDALLGKLLENLGGKPALMIFLMISVFAFTSNVMGASAEYIPFVLILAALCRTMKMDTMTAVGIIIAGYCIGYGAAAFNQYTVVVAQGIAEVETYSGMGVRLALLAPFIMIGGHHVWSYANRVQKNPSFSLMVDIDAKSKADVVNDYPAVTTKPILIMVAFLTALGVSVWGIARQGWYLYKLGAAFLMVGIFTAIVGRIDPSLMAKEFVEGAKDLTETALLVGIARGIALIMEEGQILHSIVYAMSVPLGMVGPELAAVGMMLMQTIMNFFVSSGSGQAFLTMPLMVPLGDILGLSRQIAVQAFLYGDGFANMIVPTNPVLMGILGMAGVPYDRWFRFCLPLLLKLLAFAGLCMVGMVWFGFS